MSIDFSCSKCQRTIRVPDGTEGKKTKCPQCQEIQVIPNAPAGGLPPASPPKPEPSSEKSDSLWDSLSSEKDKSPTGGAAPSNPFGETNDPFGPPARNPYASPSSHSHAYGQQAATRSAARAQLIGPAIGVLVSTVLGLLLNIVWWIASMMQVENDAGINDPEERVGVYVVLCIMFGLPTLLSLFTCVAMVRAMQVRTYGLVMCGFVLSLTPFSGGCGCILAMAFGIWGIVVMCNESVKAAFRLP
ncbi:hypothetical protein AB1L30_22595 [Bremerella sp. JC817]|uniref:hypothetical protein n=1 Tax=Bremerella sp. JC817 TaxID=3231756 RepID=UPI0034587F27